MKVLSLATDDYANFAHDNAKALRSVGVDCLDVKTHPHIYNYGSESQIATLNEIRILIASYDIIQIFHSDIRLLELAKDAGKKLIVYHTGSRYRQDPIRFNKAFNPYVDMSINALCEFAWLGAFNAKYLVGAIDFDEQTKPKPIGDTLKIAHYPSNAEVKGTRDIEQMMRSIKGDYEFNSSVDMVAHDVQIKRMNDCDVYIELYKPELEGKQYGSWGITALEAAAMGKIVVTQNLNHKHYLETYPYCPLILCNNKQDFINKVQSLVDMPKKELANLQQLHLDWISDFHSYTATGERLVELLRL